MKTNIFIGLASAMSLLFSGPYAAESAHSMYRVINLGNPGGGTSSQGTSNNQPGWVLGTSNLTGDAVMQAELWRDGPRNPSARSAVRTAPSHGRTAMIMASSRDRGARGAAAE